MSCCATGLAVEGMKDDEILLASRAIGDGLRQSDLSVPSIHCGGCIQKIERALAGLPGVEMARVNLSTRRVSVQWRDDARPPPLIETLHKIGYQAHLDDSVVGRDGAAPPDLIRALAVAAFASMNIMLLSASVWSGADPATRDLFHWISALIALPTLAYSGRIFFVSAWAALRRGHTNMDVPISIGVLLAFGLSLYETVHGGQHAYFDASVSLLFFLLIGRTLDHMMRERARTAVNGLARLAPRGALVLQPDGAKIYAPLKDIAPGMTILLAAGERVPVDARVVEGRSELDCSLVSGESVPQPASPGADIRAGMLNVAAPLTLVATASASDSLLAEMTRMMEAAESGRSSYRRIADRAARLYAPVVHLAALATFIGWMIATGDAHRAITVAIAVLIITCPCALGLAVPMVQVMAARRLFERGVMMKDGGALERLAEIDSVVFDKTGTLTRGEPSLIEDPSVDDEALAIAGALGSLSRHPYSLALATAARRLARPGPMATDVSEHPGDGVEACIDGSLYRLGRPDWAASPSLVDQHAQTILARDGKMLAGFRFAESLRPGAREMLKEWMAQGTPVEILSGDRAEPVRRLADALETPYTASVTPKEKAERIAALVAAGRKPLMVGDGLNDAPALAAAHASMAPASAADVGRNAADFVFLHDDLRAVPQTWRIARSAAALVRQNMILAVAYNAIALPVAILGHVTPLIAALAMSASSLLVIANALRLGGERVLKTEAFAGAMAGSPPPAAERAA
ncbi:MAG: nitrogen fixation protein FixI [Rhizobiales bacterium 65-9]|nr:MAG: nitrogen fixation protein FixI [Rhizobiales bacterium 65-9]